jgi:DNA-binding NtrC family response regulator
MKLNKAQAGVFMPKKIYEILILERDSFFRDRLRDICAEMGKTWVTDNWESTLNLLSRRSFGLLLLDWDVIQPDFSSILQMMDHFQPQARGIVLFNTFELNDVIRVMKAGMNDALWEYQGHAVLREKIKDALAEEKSSISAHSYVLQLAETIADRAAAQKMSLYKARKEFSKTFLSQILKHQKMKRYQLAGLMNVSLRTLRRHLLK